MQIKLPSVWLSDYTSCQHATTATEINLKRDNQNPINDFLKIYFMIHSINSGISPINDGKHSHFCKCSSIDFMLSLASHW